MKAMLFDFDGTMADSRALTIELYNRWAGEHGYKRIHEEDVENFSKQSIRERLRYLGIPIYRIPGLIREWKRKYAVSANRIKIVDGIQSTVKELSESSIRLGLVSSNAQPTIESFLTHHDMDCFQHIYCGGKLFGKNHRINRCIKSMDIDKEETVYIGDELRDIEACKQSGIPIIAVTWGYDDAELLASGQPDFIANHPSELVPLLQSLSISKG